MENLEKAVRVNTKIAADSNRWLDKKSYEMGIPKSSLISLAVENYRKESEVVKGFPQILEQLKRQGIEIENS